MALDLFQRNKIINLFRNDTTYCIIVKQPGSIWKNQFFSIYLLIYKLLILVQQLTFWKKIIYFPI